MLVILKEILAVILSFFAINIQAWALAIIEAAIAEVAVIAAVIQVLDSFIISFCLSLASISEAANFAWNLRQVSLKKSLFCFCIIGGR